MDYELRVIVEKVSISSQEVVQRDTIKVYAVKAPGSILDLGLRHAEQISVLEKVQNALLAEQCHLIESGHPVCPKCGQKLKKNGHTPSQFHAVFSDHTVRIQKHLCSNPECRWQSAPTTTSVFGTNIHPDLAKLQCEQGALFSYREAQSNLAKLNCDRRSVNNHNQVKLMSDQVGALLSAQNHIPLSAKECGAPAQALIVQIDGGHIPIQEKNKRSFEALSAIVYRPERIREVDKHHREIVDKSCAISAEDDDLTTIKVYVLNAAHKQGMNQQTKVTALGDGANNCWSVISTLQSHCQQLECILDWFHIAKKFQTVKHALAETFNESLDKVKWKLWHGKADEALTQLEFLMTNVTDKDRCSKLKGLYDYLKRNKGYLVNYEERHKANEAYTSQVAESHIESVINARHKKSGKMQWTREGAHNVLQIRAKMISREWESQWQQTVLSALISVA